MALKAFAKQFSVEPGSNVELSSIDPGSTDYFRNREEAEAALLEDTQAINLIQDRLYAEARQSLLLVLQATDAAGKDGTIRKVFGPVDPLGLNAYSFKKPTPEELSHDFLWRIHKRAPAKGEIAIFNRSHYEDVLVARVHNLVDRKVIDARYGQINNFEQLLHFYGTRIIKIYLHLSKDEQRERIQERIDIPEKRWKFSPVDLEERKLWNEYQKSFEYALERCSTPWAPWFVIPADKNWCRNALVARLVRLVLEDMNPQYPNPDFDPESIRVE